MSLEQATNLLDWWQEQSFESKSLFALSTDGSLTLRESTLYPSREMQWLFHRRGHSQVQPSVSIACYCRQGPP